MTDQYTDVSVIPVRVVEQPAPAAPPRLRAVYQTVTLTLGDLETVASQEILPASDKRVSAYVQPLDDDIVIAGNESDARNGAGTTVPATNLAPWPINDQGSVFVACLALSGPTSRIAVCASYRA